MNYVVRGATVSETWLNAISYLVKNNKEAYNLIVEIDNPVEDDSAVRQQVNNTLKELSFQTIETVANTLFPAPYYVKGKERGTFYERFLYAYPILRKIQENRNGTYFGRLSAWKYKNSEERGFNQLEETIRKLNREHDNGRGIRVMYEMSIYDPELDHNNQMGFPCLSFLSLKIRDGCLDMTAVYRNQFFLKKAYGNYLGLGRLLQFICDHTNYKLGTLTCIATHAEFEKQKVKKIYADRLLEIASSREQLRLEIAE
ncbi:hypothetical protein [Ferroacidibacillus organovorans]|uniref:Thymidylate synthase n=1 Tax=Ferroacidibacillus organovorans TaxID=1765683 RepID=A0A1V4EWD0_9BACL|nr:hypothetical protein [Ferroacidibacillus organovorans]OPG16968.1 hypothetical protein B2M26_03935 [Ferroacidibacillus organovorans]